MKDDIKRKMETLLSTDSKKENYILHIWHEMVPDERHSQIGNSFPVLHVQKLQLKKLVVIGRAFTSRFGKQLSKLKVSQKEN